MAAFQLQPANRQPTTTGSWFQQNAPTALNANAGFSTGITTPQPGYLGSIASTTGARYGDPLGAFANDTGSFPLSASTASSLMNASPTDPTFFPQPNGGGANAASTGGGSLRDQVIAKANAIGRPD